MNPASITVCVPTRNRAAWLRQTLLAMQAQTAPYDELIVGDDASRDSTRQTVEEFQDRRIRYVHHQKNLGIYPNWNDLIDRAAGDYVCIYHDHDRYLPGILEKSRRILDEHPDVAFVHTAVLLVDATDALTGADIRPFPEVMPGPDLRRALAHDWHSPVMAATTMVRRQAYRAAGPYRPGQYGLGCDKHMWFQLAGMGNVGYVAEPQAHIRIREKGIGTAEFSWEAEWGLVRMREEETAAIYAHDPAALAHAARGLARATSRRWLPRTIRALLLEPPEAWAREEAWVISRLTLGARALYQAVKQCGPVRRLAGTVGLPLHYARLAHREQAARRKALRMVAAS